MPQHRRADRAGGVQGPEGEEPPVTHKAGGLGLRLPASRRLVFAVPSAGEDVSLQHSRAPDNSPQFRRRLVTHTQHPFQRSAAGTEAQTERVCWAQEGALPAPLLLPCPQLHPPAPPTTGHLREVTGMGSCWERWAVLSNTGIWGGGCFCFF